MSSLIDNGPHSVSVSIILGARHALLGYHPSPSHPQHCANVSPSPHPTPPPLGRFVSRQGDQTCDRARGIRAV